MWRIPARDLPPEGGESALLWSGEVRMGRLMARTLIGLRDEVSSVKVELEESEANMRNSFFFPRVLGEPAFYRRSSASGGRTTINTEIKRRSGDFAKITREVQRNNEEEQVGSE